MSFYKPLTFIMHLNNEDANTTNEKQQVIVLILHRLWSIKLNQSFLSNHYYQRYVDPQKILVSTLFLQCPRNIHFNHKNTNTVISGYSTCGGALQNLPRVAWLLEDWPVVILVNNRHVQVYWSLYQLATQVSGGYLELKERERQKRKTQFLAATVCKVFLQLLSLSGS